MRTTRATLAGLAVGAALALTACGTTTTSSANSSASGASIVVAQVTEPDTIPDPVVDGSLAGYNYYYNVFDRLVMLDADGALQPQLATGWESNEDFTRWTFTVRDDVTFHDGSALTAADVAFTYQQILESPESQLLEYMQVLESVSASEDGSAVVFDLNAPFSPWPSITTAVSIVPQAVYEDLGSEAFAESPVGSGPFSFVSRTRGVEYVVERYDDYWGGAPEVERITFQTVADEDARLNGVLSGSIDVALVSPSQVAGVEGDSAIDLESLISNGVTFLGVNTQAGALQDPLVRKAIVHAIDRESIVENVLAGSGSATSQIVAESVTGFAPSVGVAEYDPDLARSLLTEAGYAGEPIAFEYATDGRIPLSTEVAQAIQGFLQDVGINVTMTGMDQASLSGRIYGTMDMKGLFLNTWAPSTMDGDMPATNMFAGGANDYTKSAETATLVATQRTVSGEERVAVFAELAALNIDQGLLIPLYSPQTVYAIDPALGWTPRVDGLYAFADTSVE
ncbi:ABC transporter substrate-binding protein [Cellulomonas xiejunii]|uniref:ABC transporter substrate-binding protein n=1 Tax=Cellulomonas xiejunii TaxID=2968083 RepID=A0ABY5KVQ6_9CELL|nr:ABC transporter substrate-binding protein [Cellulomonas xiejunii]MCC2323045.1 ABC transporter substrate-binding protein [Cellulomonas xiejunii]UUI73541.1 ABC transporter substrate-binding protein [Cellulomonas xiejunii]